MNGTILKHTLCIYILTQVGTINSIWAYNSFFNAILRNATVILPNSNKLQYAKRQ